MSQILSPPAREEMEQFAERAKEIYRGRLAAVLEPACNGKIVAIEPESGDYFLGENEIQAVERAKAAGHAGPFYFLRVGSLYARRWITPRR